MREHRQPEPPGRGDGVLLVAGGAEHLRGRADEVDADGGEPLGQLGVLGQGPVAGVDGGGPAPHGRRDDPADVVVRLGEALAVEVLAAVRAHGVQLLRIGPGGDRDRGPSERPEGLDGPGRDRTAVGDQNSSHGLLSVSGECGYGVSGYE
ncbi:hypothetical protein WKI68_25920 [Streptomyces sp. MS1.HAVA.3]|uniref:Uncharacterized protein n=1 Tax=Streptomyces caledonius TaxID=3134107 RepID=A0ABU8U7L4_9ACTN